MLNMAIIYWRPSISLCYPFFSYHVQKTYFGIPEICKCCPG